MDSKMMSNNGREWMVMVTQIEAWNKAEERRKKGSDSRLGLARSFSRRLRTASLSQTSRLPRCLQVGISQYQPRVGKILRNTGFFSFLG